ncbi:MAG: PEP-CTERM sorting domain-containing protein, partial [Caldimonas sp.]
YQTISFGTLFPEYGAPGTTHVFANNRAYADLGRLYANAGVVDNSVEEAAFQIAVWEISYETTAGAYALGSGAASFSGGTADSSGALGLAATWLAGLGNSAGRNINVIESSAHQDIIFAPVPEPSTYMLMLAGLMATVEISRRKRKQV